MVLFDNYSSYNYLKELVLKYNLSYIRQLLSLQEIVGSLLKVQHYQDKMGLPSKMFTEHNYEMTPKT